MSTKTYAPPQLKVENGTKVNSLVLRYEIFPLILHLLLLLRRPSKDIHYTDDHDVDEDMMGIFCRGGWCVEKSEVGAFVLHTNNNYNDVYVSVASSNTQSARCTDSHDVDEDWTTTLAFGGQWDNNIGVGVVFRNMSNLNTDTYPAVASNVKKGSPPLSR